jgi:hypothetical protein
MIMTPYDLDCSWMADAILSQHRHAGRFPRGDESAFF